MADGQALETRQTGRHVRAFGGYQPALDGIRGLGMFAMMGYHAQMSWADGAFLSLSQFFTLSGFLITAILLDEHDRNRHIDLGRFYTRRFRRLGPAAILGLVGVAIFGATVATRAQAERLPEEVLGVVAYVVNWVFVSTEQSYTDLFASPSPVQHYWSLAVEEQFYVIVPITLFLLFKLRVGRAGIALLLGVAAIASTVWMIRLYETGTDLDRIYYGTDTRLAEMLIGALLAVLLHHIGIDFSQRVRRVIGVAGAVAFAVLAWMWVDLQLTDPATWRGAFQLNAALTGVMIVAIVAGAGPVVRLYSLRPLVELGKLSYGVYIFHFPIFLWLDEDRTGLDQWPLFALRLVVTLVVAVASYRLVERPVRMGADLGLPRLGRFAAYPVAGLLVVSLVAVTADTSGADPLATLRTDDDTTVPIAAPDGVLDILLVADAGQADVVEELRTMVAGEDAIRLTEAEPFACVGGLTATEAGETCANWAEEWPDLVAETDPDTVMLFVDDWVGEVPDGELTPVLDAGFELLTDRGANLVWSASGATAAEIFRRALQPFSAAMGELVAERADTYSLLSGVMPNPDTTTEEEFRTASAAALLDNIALYQRADRDDDVRVMVVGDSQARSLGYGLERWGAENDVWVWNTSVNGCGVADEGFTFGSGEAQPVSDACTRVVDDWSRQVASFDPDVVVVFSSLWDLGPRQLDGWEEPLVIGDPRVDDYLEREYLRAVDVLSEGGARVVWMQAPCVELASGVGGVDPAAPDPLRPEVLDRFNGELLPTVARQRAGVVSLFDLGPILCPDGEPIQEADGISPIRGDGIHFNIDGSAWFADRYGRDLLAVGGVEV